MNTRNSSSPPVRPRPVTSPSSRIRKNLIYKLGVDVDKPENQSPREPSRGSLLGNVQMSREPLKYIDEAECREDDFLWNIVNFFGKKSSPQPTLDASLSCSLSTTDGSSSGASAARKLTFNEEVTVCPIPKRDEYSKRIRDRLWPTAEEMMLNAHRNSVEFAAEGWDWRNSMEDDEMYRCVLTNELVHPIHVEQQSISQEEEKQC